ncbi:MAG: hypothetical protein JST40_07010 [Armatimonadetes bacterium]|nr:hypothetical protein [Armatimonadota bacterium]
MGKRLFVLAGSIFAAGFALVSSGRAVPTGYLFEPHEENEDSMPWVRAVPRYSVPPVQHRNGFVLHQVNVSASGLNIVGDAANEPSMTVDPNNPNKLAVGWRQFDSITSDFRQAGFGYSSNGGATWTFPGRIEPGVFRSDPVLSTNSAGDFYYLSLQDTFYCTLFKSTNGGGSYSSLGPAVGGDKQWYTVVHNANAGNGVMHQVWSTAGNNYSGRQYSRSTNEGATWSSPINIPDKIIWGTVDFGKNGELYLAGTSGTQFGLSFARSVNASTGASATWDYQRMIFTSADLAYGVSINPGGLSGQVWICSDRSNGPRSGYLYVLSTVGSSSGTDVYFSRSTNNGNTWSAPVRVNDDASAIAASNQHHHWFGTMACAPNGRLDAIWNDTREDPTNKTRSAVYYSYSLDGGLTWSANVPVTDTFNPLVGYPVQNKIGDYTALVADNAGSHAVFSATFNGEEDLYHVRLPAPAVTVSGTVNLSDSLGAPTGNPLAVQVRNASGALVQSTTATLGSTGGYSFALDPNLVHQSLTITVKASHWLAKAVTSSPIDLVGKSGVNYSLINGDVDGDNSITIFDYSALSAAFDSSVGDGNYNAEADLDGDGSITIFDYLILSSNFDLFGSDWS